VFIFYSESESELNEEIFMLYEMGFYEFGKFFKNLIVTLD